MDFITTTQDSSGPLEVTRAEYSTLVAFDQNSADALCVEYSVELLDMTGAAWTDSRVTAQSNTDGTTSLLVDRSSPQAEFSLMLRATSVGGIQIDVVLFVLVQASGTTCTYTGSPASKTQAIPYPITAAVSIPLSTIFTYGSNDDSATACPLNQILWHFNTGSGYAFVYSTPFSLSSASFNPPGPALIG